ncbi:hypothetical protein Vretimale_5981 [Volvox reticuliferus]|uniref:Uncharacterized protein n=1 Tax=Volvox reticuliferus TaxID=1737510 RepID=A0A8J4LKI4_9CHLO|nr:hypothetical protein Vretifemale_6034 [Volvox reticuliferus]GIM01150.1 hypothetical protein Vretimale_5981 [Volvox reticuliferus]
MPPTDKAAAAQRIQELYKDDMDMMVILLASLTTLGNAEFLDLCKVWGTLFGSPAEKPYLDRVLSGMAAGPGPGSMMTKDMTDTMHRVEAKLVAIEAKLVAVEAKVEAVEAKVEAVEAKVEAVEAKVEAKLEDVGARVEAVDTSVKSSIKDLNKMVYRVLYHFAQALLGLHPPSLYRARHPCRTRTPGAVRH